MKNISKLNLHIRNIICNFAPHVMNISMKKIVLAALMVTTLCAMSESVSAQVGPPPPQPECKDIVYRKWNDVLFVDNGNEEYVSYQWYRNHVAIDGATRQYLYTEGVVMEGDGNIYHVVATRANGSQAISCEGLFEDFSASASLNPGKVIKKAVLYNYRGEKISEWNERPERPDVGSGCYIWLFTDDKGNFWSESVLL